MDGNDTYGDCTIAALAHAETTYRGLLGDKQAIHLFGGVYFGFQVQEDCEQQFDAR